MRKKKFFLCVLSIVLFTTGCVEDIDKSDRYTFIGQTIVDYLEEHDDVFSDFIYILQRSGRLSLLKAYGVYTCFAPTNDAVRHYLIEQDSIWRASLLPDSKQEIWTGITSPVLEELSDSMCKVISNTHILTNCYLTMDMKGDVLPTTNLNSRFLTLDFGVDEALQSYILINGERIIVPDNEVENGVVHAVAGVLNPSSRTLAAHIADTKFLSIFNEALQKTGLSTALEPYKDFTYSDGDKMAPDMYFGTITCHYPLDRFYGFTVFCEPDEVFHKEGIYNVNDLYRKCKEWYPDATDEDFNSSNNALNKFISYHIIDRRLPYSRLVCYNIVCNYYAPEATYFADEVFASEMKYVSNADRFDYFETLQGTILKVIMPKSNRNVYTLSGSSLLTPANSIFLNYQDGLMDASDPLHTRVGKRDTPVNILVMNPADINRNPDLYPDFNSDALNGNIQLISQPLVYDEDVMAGYVLNEMIRIDFASIVPEFTNNFMRWYNGSGVTFYGYTPGLFYIPAGYSDRLKINSPETFLYYQGSLNPYNMYQGDLMSAEGNFDIAYRLPHVPPGTYELRIGYTSGSDRGIVQYYVDDEITGIPVDMRRDANDPQVGWVKDSDTEDNGVSNDKMMKNRGYVKGPNTFYMSDCKTTARDFYRAFRLVLTTKYLTEGDHWIRMKTVKENEFGADIYMHDYFELVPISWLRNENISLKDRRK